MARDKKSTYTSEPQAWQLISRENIMHSRLLGLIVGTLAVGACAFTPQKAEIAPHVDFVRSAIGGGKQVSVAVTDERDSTDIGHRGGGAGSGATISSDQNITEVFRAAIFDGLREKGFVPVDFDKSVPRQLHVEVRAIGYSTSVGFWTGGIDTKAAVEARAGIGANVYEKLYRYANEERVVVVPTAEHNNRLINNAVDSVLSQMFADEALLAALAVN